VALKVRERRRPSLPTKNRSPPLSRTMETVLAPHIHEHVMIPWNDLRKGDCCGRLEAISDGYYCKTCDFFVHKECGDSSEYIQNPSHSIHTLRLQSAPYKPCGLCGRDIVNLGYTCDICEFFMDLRCVRYPPPDDIYIPDTHCHKLTLLKEEKYCNLLGNYLFMIMFECGANCGEIANGFPYKCHECDLTFHVDCVWHTGEAKHQSEINHSFHSLHPLKLFKGEPQDYSDGKCRLCGRKVEDDKLFYHCSSCNFTLDMRCVLNPPAQALVDLKTHHHQLTLLPRLVSFTCNVCGLNGDRSPYVCVPCVFMIHKDCFRLPRLININRHDHRVFRTSLLGVVGSVCGVCRGKVDWTCGGYSCHKCPGYVVHSKCATRKDVWNGKELQGIPEETEDIEPYVIIDDNTIQHFSHKEHNLRLNTEGILCEESKRCIACVHPILLDQSFYYCMVCDFILHKNCAELPIKKWHVLHNDRFTLDTSKLGRFSCVACRGDSNGFRYQVGEEELDVRCGSVSEPFNHPSHPQHTLYFMSKDVELLCHGCYTAKSPVLICIEDGCGFVLDFKCATLPQVIKHRVDDHPLSLCFGEKANGKHWCDVCEKEIDPRKWFYTCKDQRACLHTNCVLGDFKGLMPGSTVEICDRPFEVVLNNSICRPFCWYCKSRCMPPIILKMHGCSNTYICSSLCNFYFMEFVLERTSILIDSR
ncbi:unnamed protein product, partial [Thlaspi arvense]